MRITEIEKLEYYEMTILDGKYGDRWTTFRRIDSKTWEVLMGASWETVWKCDDLELLFIKYNK